MEKNNVVAIVVTYNIGKKYLKNFNSLINQVDKIIIIDNNSDENTKSILKKIELDNIEKVNIIYNDDNLGLAKAQNIGIAYAKKLQSSWILLLDNDSCLGKDMVKNMIKSYLDYKNKNIVAIISPLIVDKNSSKETKYICKEGIIGFKRKKIIEKVTDTVLCTIASGSLIKLDIINEIGEFKEEYFIDSIDTEFCMRIICNKYKILVIRDAVLYHELGEKKDYEIMGIKITPTNHNALRRYYIYRNRIKMWKEYWRKIPKYIIYEILASFYQILLIIFLEADKKKKLKMIAKGICDGVK